MGSGNAVEMGEQHVVHRGSDGCIVTMGSAYDVTAANSARDVVVNASYMGVLPARFVGRHRPRGSIGVDCAIGKDGAGIAGLWYLEALGVPAAAADVFTVELGNGDDLYANGVVNRVNAIAESMGVRTAMAVREAAAVLLEEEIVELAAEDVTNRKTVAMSADGREVVCTDSIAFGLPIDRGRNVLCTAGHTGRSAVPYLLEVAPHGFICSDGGRGKHDSGIAALGLVEPDGLAGATVDARTARMGDGLSTYYDGIISACNEGARLRGVREGQPAREAAELLLAVSGDGR
jgi:hypothetical protein